MGWLASQTKLDKLHRFLYTASSKGVHFSPHEALRSAWSESLTGDAEITIMADAYRTYRTDFSLSWLCVLLLDTAIVVLESEQLREDELDEQAEQAVLAAAEDIGAIGQLPIVLAAEFNLPRYRRAT